MRITRASSLVLFFGVRDAIDLAVQRSRRAPLTILGELVHNESVLASLRQRGIQLQHDHGKVATTDVMVTAHGTSERTLGILHAQGLKVVQATCPLVHHAHQAVQRLVRQQYHPVIVGKREHVEVRGITDDLLSYDVVLSEEDVKSLRERPRFGVAAQTTQPLEKVLRLVELMRQRFPNSEVRFEDTVCQPTKQRQTAAIALAQNSDVVVVVGGPNSNNTQELVRTCHRFCALVHHVQRASDLRPEWFDNCQSVGLTAGTSTPDVTIEEVEAWLREFAQQTPKASLRRAPHSGTRLLEAHAA